MSLDIIGHSVATVLGAAIALFGVGLQAYFGKKTAQITADNQARMQSEKLRHDTFLAEIAFKRAKLEELYNLVARATAYYTLSVAIFRSGDTPSLAQQLERYNDALSSAPPSPTTSSQPA